MKWSEALIAELAERRAIILMGAGASMGAERAGGTESPPSWIELLTYLQESAELASDEAEMVDDLIAKEKHLDAAEIILSGLDPANFRRILRERLHVPSFSASPIHEKVLEIDPKIVVTTNYDAIYDDYCRQGQAEAGYSVKTYACTDLLDEIRSTARIVIKAHGCVTSPSKVVLSRSQFYSARANHPAFFEILGSIFLTSTVLFVGYSLSDPDITLLLENASIAAPCAHSHYALVPQGLSAPVRTGMERAYNLKFVEYDADDGNHQGAVLALGELRDQVLAYRAKYQVG